MTSRAFAPRPFGDTPQLLAPIGGEYARWRNTAAQSAPPLDWCWVRDLPTATSPAAPSPAIPNSGFDASQVAVGIAACGAIEMPGPYCRWQDLYPAAMIRDRVQHFCKRFGVEILPLVVLQTWSAAWNDDPQPLMVMRQLCEEGLISAVGLACPTRDPHCVISPMRDGLLDAVITPMSLANQTAAAAILPTASDSQTGVIVIDPLKNLDYQAIATELATRNLADVYSPIDASVQFLWSHPAVNAIVAPADQYEACVAAFEKPMLPDDFLRGLRRHHVVAPA